MSRPQSNDYAAYYARYIDKVKADSLQQAIQTYSGEMLNFYNSLPEAKADYRYAEGKWTIKELFLHVIDADRIFAYRALRIARNDQTPLPGFDENAYVPQSFAGERSLWSLKDEFTAVRRATDLLLLSFNEEQLARQGTASNQPVTVNALGFIIYGHLLHHKSILEERYLSDAR